MEPSTTLAARPAHTAPMRPPVGPGAGVMSIPPASIPLAFLATAGLGLIAFGIAAAAVADDATVWAMHPHVTATAHLAMLGFLTMAVAGALHQFGPVVGQRRLRSNAVARASHIGLVITVTLLPIGFARGPENLVPIGGVIGAITVSLIAWNLSGPLGRQASGVPVWGLRLSVVLLLATVGFGVTYAFNRQTGWFPLYPHRLLAHVHLGLFGWLGLTYAAVAEKLWPMFLLAHRPKSRAGAWAVGLMAAGVPVLALGLLFAVPYLAWPGGIAVAAGLACHVTSLAGAVRHRRRPLELLHAFLFASTACLVTGAVLAVVAAAAPVDTVTRTRLVTAEVAALMGWVSLAIVGHAHKIVPFIAYSVLRNRGVATNPEGRQLLFADLFDHRVARVTCACAAAAFATLIVGILAAAPTAVAIGAVGVAATGVLTTSNLALGPHRAARGARPAPAPDLRGSTA